MIEHQNLLRKVSVITKINRGNVWIPDNPTNQYMQANMSLRRDHITNHFHL